MPQEQENWTNIHKDFAKQDHGKTFQQWWEERGIIKQEAKVWINIGFKPENCKEIGKWRNLGFTHYQVQEWLVILRRNETELAAYCRGKKYNLEEIKKGSIKFREEYKKWKNVSDKPVQEYFDLLYPLVIRDKVKRIFITNKNLTGLLNLQEFVNLRELDCSNNNLVGLNIFNCLQLTFLECSDNQLTDLSFLQHIQKEKLTYLSIKHNKFSPSDLSVFSQFSNLEDLYVGYNRFFGSFEPLMSCKNLRRLGISNTDIVSNLEHLPESLEKIWCTGQLAETLEPYKNKNNNYYDYLAWRKVAHLQKQLENLKVQLTTKTTEKDKNLEELAQIKKEFTNLSQNQFNSQAIISSFQENQIIKEKNRRIAYLEEKIRESNNLIQKLKAKIIDAYLYFSPEEKLMKELITTHINFNQAKKKKMPVIDLRKKLNKAYEELENNLEKEMMEKVEIILTDCEELITLEYQLTESENELKEKKEFIKESEGHIFNITHNNVTIQEGHAFIGQTTTGDNTDLGYSNKLIENSQLEISKELQSQIQIPPKSN